MADDTPDSPAQPHQTPAPRRRAAATPFARDELTRSLRHPAGWFELVLADRARLGASVTAARDLDALAWLLLCCAVAAALPCGLVLAPDRFWKVALLYLGSVLLCSPALQVFSAYLGHRSSPMQTVVLALLVAAVAALFSLGFAPILWFLDATMRDGDQIVARDLVGILLIVALLAGLGQVLYSIASGWERGLPRGAALVLIAWEALVVAITFRMARTLDLF